MVSCESARDVNITGTAAPMTTVAFFACCNVVAIPLIVASGVVTASTWRTALVAVPSVLVGNAIGARLAPRVRPERFRGLVLGLMGLAAVGALAAAFG